MYPRHLNTYGDGGNLLALRMRCRWRGIDTVLWPVDPGDRLPRRADVVFIGGGQDRSQTVVAPALQQHRDGLEALVDDGAVVLGVCAGYQFLGHRIVQSDGSVLDGLGLLDVVTAAGAERCTGKIVVDPHPALELPATLVGFENHGGRTRLGGDPETRPLGRVVRGHGNGDDEGTEGAFRGDVFGTYLHGPVLPTNPGFCDLLIRRALNARGATTDLEPLPDGVEHDAAAAYRT
jgi:CobQ-like glutamine amidotransferase family enzyme